MSQQCQPIHVSELGQETSDRVRRFKNSSIKDEIRSRIMRRAEDCKDMQSYIFLCLEQAMIYN